MSSHLGVEGHLPTCEVLGRQEAIGHAEELEKLGRDTHGMSGAGSWRRTPRSFSELESVRAGYMLLLDCGMVWSGEGRQTRCQAANKPPHIACADGRFQVHAI